MPSPSNTLTRRPADADQRRDSVRSSIWSSPALVAAVLTAAAFALLLFILRPGYWINDDVKMIWLMAGYPGSAGTSPFPVYSNVLLGLALAPLYATGTSANWWVLLLILLNACSTYSLLWLVMAARRSTLLVILGSTASLIGVAALTLNVTYTMTALLATVAGVLLVWASARPSGSRRMLLAACGCALIVAGGLLRLQMLLLGVLLAIPILVGSWRSLDVKRLGVTLVTAGLLILVAHGFNRLYVRASPDWNRFYAYTSARQQLHDSHRLNNVHTEIRRVGWTPNDQELFAHWFFPDEQLFSLEKLKYIVNEVPPESQDLWGSVGQFVDQLGLQQHFPYLLWMIAILAGALAAGVSARVLAVCLFTWGIALGANLILTVIYKDPDYVLAGSLAGSLALNIAYLRWSPAVPADQRARRTGTAAVTRFLVELSLTLFLLGAVALLGNLVTRSAVNTARQRDYARFRSDLETLQDKGVLDDQALIISPAHGLPIDWAPPLTLDLPAPPYLDTGWITFSPSYHRVLNDYGITSLPEALITQDNIYLMAELSFTGFLSRYYEERGGPPVLFESLYEMPVSRGLLPDDPIRLYKLSIAE